MQRYSNLYFTCQSSTGFRHFFRLSPGAQKLYTQHRVLSRILLPTAGVGKLELTHASSRQQKNLTIPDAVFTVYELLMMGEKTA